MNLDNSLAAQSALRDMGDSAEKIEAVWRRLESHGIVRLASEPMTEPELSGRFVALARTLRVGGRWATQPGMVPGVNRSSPIFMSELGWCQIIAREMLNYFEAMYCLQDSQKGGGS